VKYQTDEIEKEFFSFVVVRETRGRISRLPIAVADYPKPSGELTLAPQQGMPANAHNVCGARDARDARDARYAHTLRDLRFERDYASSFPC
jgi:hypothetical protein